MKTQVPKVKATGYWAQYGCGCVSNTYKRLPNVPKRCAVHTQGFTRTVHSEFGSPNLNFSK